MPRLALHWQITIAMLLGASAGIVLNVWFSTRTVEFQPPGTQFEVTIRDSLDRVEIDVTDTATGQQRRHIVDLSGKNDEALHSLADLEQQDPQAFRWFHDYGRSPARRIGGAGSTVGDLFLRLLKMISVPLIITSLITGVTSLGSAGRLGRMFGRTISYYLATSMLAIVTGLTLVNLIRPGIGVVPPRAPAVEEAEPASLLQVLYAQLEALIPVNPLAAVAEGNFLSIISFSLLFGIFTILAGGRTAEIIRDLFRAGFEVMMKMTLAIIRLAPLGVLALMLAATATQGVAIFQSLGWYMLTVFLALTIHAVVVLPLIVKFVAKRNPRKFAEAMSPALLTAFSSASSNATLPLTLTCAEERAGISNRVGSFVLPLGATINMDGTALYEVIAVLFIAQLDAGVNLSLTDQIIVAVTALMASVGAAGIPHAGLVMMIIILQAVGLPTHLQGIILAVDRILDMCRTSVNVWSDSCGCAVVARLEARPQAGARSTEVDELAEEKELPT